MRARALLRCARLCAPFALAACSGPLLYQPPPCSGQANDPSVATPRRLHVRLALVHDGREQRHELVVDSEPGRVVAVGLTPMGTLAYRVTHDGEGVRVENGIGRYMGLDPDLAYDAVVRALLRPAAPETTLPPGGPTPDPQPGLSVVREECHYRARLVVVSDRALPASDAPAPR